MSHGVVSAGSQSSFQYSLTSSNSFSIRKSMVKEPCFPYLSFNSHLSKLSFSLKTQRGRSQNTAVQAALRDCTGSCLCVQISNGSFYDLLGIPEGGTLTEIKLAYKQLVLKYHPDVSPPERIEEYTKRFIQVQEAYETLSDPQRRALYDRELARGSHRAFLHKEGLNERGEWRQQWQSQLAHLKRRSMSKDSRDDMSWGARMRRRRREADDHG